MSTEQLEELYITVPEIAAECGVSAQVVHNWINYRRYLDKDYVLGRPVVKRTQYEAFKSSHGDVIEAAKAALESTPAPA